MSKLKKQKVLSCLIVFAMLFAFFPGGALAASLSDIQGHWAAKEIQSWVENGLIKGYPDNTFKPDNRITRAEFMVLVNGAFGYTQKADADYKDVKADDWYYSVIACAKAAGYISGYPDGSMKPNNPITRAEAASIIMRIKGLEADAGNTAVFKDNAVIPGWSKGAVGAVVKAGIMKGYPDGTFKADNLITRAEAVVALDKAKKAAAEESVKVYDIAGTYGPAQGVSEFKGNIIVKAAGVTIRNMVIDGDLTIDKAVGEGDVTLQNVTVKGTAYIYGGGANSIHVVDSYLPKAVVEKTGGMVRIVAQGKSEVGQVVAASDVKLQTADLTGKGFAELVVDKKAEVQIVEAKIEKVEIKAEADVKVDAKSEIKDLVIKAEGTKINTEKGAVIKTLVADAKVEVKGQAVIENAKINASGVVLETEPQNKEVAQGVDAPTINTPNTSVTNTGGGGGGGGGGSSSDSSIYYNVKAGVFPSGVGALVNVDKTKAKKGETVTVNITGIPDNMVFKQIRDKSGNISFTEVEKGKKYSFSMPAADVEIQVLLITKEQAAIDELQEKTKMTVSADDNVITANIKYPDSISSLLQAYKADAAIISNVPFPEGTEIEIKYNNQTVANATLELNSNYWQNEQQDNYYTYLSYLIRNRDNRPSITAHAGRTDTWDIKVTLDKGKYLEADIEILSVIVDDSQTPERVIAYAATEQPVSVILDERYHTYKFEIRDLPEEGYFITHNLLDNPNDSIFNGMTPVKIKLALDEERKNNYDGLVRIEVSAPDNLQLWAKDTNGIWWDITKVGWGPQGGFKIDLNAETEVYVVAKDEGYYEFTVQLIDVTNDYGADEGIITEQTFVLEAYDEDTDAAIKMAKAMQPMAVSINDNTVTATIYYPNEISPLLNNWLTDAIIVSNAPVPAGTQIGIKYNGAEVTTATIGEGQGQVKVNEWSYDDGGKEYYVFLSELIGSAGTTRPPITAHAERTDTWEITFTLPNGQQTFTSGTRIIFDSIISKDNFKTWIILVRGEIDFN